MESYGEVITVNQEQEIEIEQVKKDWELNRLKQLKEEEERKAEQEENDMMFTYTKTEVLTTRPPKQKTKKSPPLLSTTCPTNSIRTMRSDRINSKLKNKLLKPNSATTSTTKSSLNKAKKLKLNKNKLTKSKTTTTTKTNLSTEPNKESTTNKKRNQKDAASLEIDHKQQLKMEPQEDLNKEKNELNQEKVEKIEEGKSIKSKRPYKPKEDSSGENRVKIPGKRGRKPTKNKQPQINKSEESQQSAIVQVELKQDISVPQVPEPVKSVIACNLPMEKPKILTLTAQKSSITIQPVKTSPQPVIKTIIRPNITTVPNTSTLKNAFTIPSTLNRPTTANPIVITKINNTLPKTLNIPSTNGLVNQTKVIIRALPRGLVLPSNPTTPSSPSSSSSPSSLK